MKTIQTIKRILLTLIGTFFLFQCAYSQGIKKFKPSFYADTVNSGGNSLTGKLMLDYTFKDTLNNDVHISDFRGKFVFVDLWYSGCGECIVVNRALRSVHDGLKDENIIFLSISVDNSKEKWLQSVTLNALPSKIDPWAGKYVPALGTVVLNTGKSGYNNYFVKKYDRGNAYPMLLFIDPTGKLITDHPPRPDYSGEDRPEELAAFLTSYLHKFK